MRYFSGDYCKDLCIILKNSADLKMKKMQRIHTKTHISNNMDWPQCCHFACMTHSRHISCAKWEPRFVIRSDGQSHFTLFHICLAQNFDKLLLIQTPDRLRFLSMRRVEFSWRFLWIDFVGLQNEFIHMERSRLEIGRC